MYKFPQSKRKRTQPVCNMGSKFAVVSYVEKAILKEFMRESCSSDVLKNDKLIDTLPKRIRSVKQRASISQCMQVVRDMSIVAPAEDVITDNKLLVVYAITDRLEISRSLVT